MKSDGTVGQSREGRGEGTQKAEGEMHGPSANLRAAKDAGNIPSRPSLKEAQQWQAAESPLPAHPG